MERYTQKDIDEAKSEFREELALFSYDGLTALAEDLEAGTVVRGSWAGCLLSYRAGAAGSSRRDRLGRARNPLTVGWDNGWLTNEDALALVKEEIERRAAALPSQAETLSGQEQVPAP